MRELQFPNWDRMTNGSNTFSGHVSGAAETTLTLQIKLYKTMLFLTSKSHCYSVEPAWRNAMPAVCIVNYFLRPAAEVDPVASLFAELHPDSTASTEEEKKKDLTPCLVSPSNSDHEHFCKDFQCTCVRVTLRPVPGSGACRARP